MEQQENDAISPLNWGNKIEEVRNRLGIHQTDLCTEAGISPCTYQKIKGGVERDMTACCAFWSVCVGQ